MTQEDPYNNPMLNPPQTLMEALADRQKYYCNWQIAEMERAKLAARMQPKECEALLQTAVPCVIKPKDPTKALTQNDIENAFVEQSARIEQDNLDGMKTMLGAQAQTLHLLFAQAVEKYASGRSENGYAYGNIALKAQNYFRMTVAALAEMKNRKLSTQDKNPGTN